MMPGVSPGDPALSQAVEPAPTLPAAAPPSGPPVPTIVLRGEDETSDQDVVAADAEALGVPRVIAHLLRARGVVERDAQATMLEPRLASLRPPTDMAGFEAALGCIEDALTHRRRIGVFGDYDVDGVCTATILTTFLEALGATVVARVADRGRGYGLTVADAQSFAEAGAGLVLTGDCGTSDVEALSWLQEQGIARVVIDHHQVPERMPPADALINPHQPGCGFPFKGMCSAGVAFYLCAALRTRLAARGQGRLPDPRAWLDLVALATVCDMMPLHAENRVLVTHGLRLAEHRKRPGLAALLSQAGVEANEPLDESHFAFKLGPRLNAPGRLGSAEPSLRLLRARSEAEAAAVAEQIETLNATRKRHTERTVVEAMALLAADPKLQQRAALVVAHDGWLPGVVGIAAAQVTESQGRPALILAVDRARGEARGSVRTHGDIDVRAALGQCRDLLERFGGHRQAAGVTVKAEHIDALTEAFDAAVALQLGAMPQGPGDVEVVDARLPPRRVDGALVEAIDRLGPYGMGFAPPRFCCDEARVHSARVLKERHLSLVLDDGGELREAMAFSQAYTGVVGGDRIGCVYVPFIDRFRGQIRVRLRVERLWKLGGEC